MRDGVYCHNDQVYAEEASFRACITGDPELCSWWTFRVRSNLYTYAEFRCPVSIPLEVPGFWMSVTYNRWFSDRCLLSGAGYACPVVYSRSVGILVSGDGYGRSVQMPAPFFGIYSQNSAYHSSMRHIPADIWHTTAVIRKITAAIHHITSIFRT